MALAAGHESSMMEQLPPEIMVRVLDFIDVPTRIKLARCNLTLQQRVYTECRDAWTSIKMQMMDRKLRIRFTDLDLSRLLDRINAREVLKELELNDCLEIRGTGLAIAIEKLTSFRTSQSLANGGE